MTQPEDDEPAHPRAITVVLPPELRLWLVGIQADLRRTQGIRISLSEVVRSKLESLKDAADGEPPTKKEKKTT